MATQPEHKISHKILRQIQFQIRSVEELRETRRWKKTPKLFIDLVHTYTTQQEAEADARSDTFGFKGMHTHSHTHSHTHTHTHLGYVILT